jgi:glutamyl-tRNA synthetase
VKIVHLVKERINFIRELWDQAAYFFIPPETYEEKAVRKRWKSETPAQLVALIAVLESANDFTAKPLEELVLPWIEAKAYPLSDVMNAFRLALVGESKGPHIFDIAELLGQAETIRRIKKAIQDIPI